MIITYKLNSRVMQAATLGGMAAMNWATLVEKAGFNPRLDEPTVSWSMPRAPYSGTVKPGDVLYVRVGMVITITDTRNA